MADFFEYADGLFVNLEQVTSVTWGPQGRPQRIITTTANGKGDANKAQTLPVDPERVDALVERLRKGHAMPVAD